MRKSLLFICTENPEVEKAVSALGESLPIQEAIQFSSDAFMAVNLEYNPTFMCEEGSQMWEDLTSNGGMYQGHKYGLVKDVVFS